MRGLFRTTLLKETGPVALTRNGTPRHGKALLRFFKWRCVCIASNEKFQSDCDDGCDENSRLFLGTFNLFASRKRQQLWKPNQCSRFPDWVSKPIIPEHAWVMLVNVSSGATRTPDTQPWIQVRMFVGHATSSLHCSSSLVSSTAGVMSIMSWWLKRTRVRKTD
jgi:hypothetical protein